jgi:hypothetical protein
VNAARRINDLHANPGECCELHQQMKSATAKNGYGAASGSKLKIIFASEGVLSLPVKKDKDGGSVSLADAHEISEK